MGQKLKVLRTDGGGEYFSGNFIRYLKDLGIVHESTNPDTPQENGVAERVNRTLVSMVVAMLESVKSKVGRTAWPYALRHAMLIKDITPHSALPDGTSPYQLWTCVRAHPGAGLGETRTRADPRDRMPFVGLDL